MKKKFFLIFLILSLHLSAATPPNIDVVNRVVKSALQANIKSLQQSRQQWSCEYDMIHDPEIYYGNGKDLRDATTALQLVCIKTQCDTLGEAVNQSKNKLKHMPEKDLRDLFEYQGFSAEEIEAKILEVKNKPEASPVINCITGNDLFRVLAFDSCLAIPVVCKKN